MNQKNKILIVRPAPGYQGGISHYFNVLEKHFSLPVMFFIRGPKSKLYGAKRLILPFIYLYDIAKYIVCLLAGNYKLIHINTSIGYAGLLRDLLFIIIGKLSRAKILVFFRGIHPELHSHIRRKHLWWFSVFFTADTILVLSEEFKRTLLSWGYKKKIIVETTAVDNTLVENIEEKSIVKKCADEQIQILFLARVEKYKGIYQTIDAFNTLLSKYPNISLCIAGEGNELENVKQYVRKHHSKNIAFEGYVEGEKKRHILHASHIYILPSYSEGLPNSVLEAMACGLIIISTKVGGIVDFFVQRKNGILVDDIRPATLASAIEQCITDKDFRMNASIANFLFAQRVFLASEVAKRLENIYRQLISCT